MKAVLFVAALVLAGCTHTEKEYAYWCEVHAWEAIPDAETASAEVVALHEQSRAEFRRTCMARFGYPAPTEAR